MSFTKNVFANVGSVAIGSIIYFIFILSLPRWLSVGGYASFLSATAVVAIGEMASDFGARIWATKQFSFDMNIGRVFWQSLSAKIFYSLLFLSILTIFPIKLLSLQALIIVFFISITQPSTDPFLWYLIAKERLDVESLIQLVWRISNSLVLLLLSYLGNAVMTLLLAWLVMNIIRLIAEFNLSIVRPLKSKLFKNRILKNLFCTKIIFLVFPIGMAFILMTLYQRLGVLYLGEISNPRVVAIYGVAFTLVSAAGFLAPSITVASFPLLISAMKRNDISESKRILNRKLRLVMSVYIMGFFIGSLISPIVVSSFYDKMYMPSAKVIFLLLPGLYISSINFSLKYLMNALALNWYDAFSASMGIMFFSSLLLGVQWENLALVAGVLWGGGEFVIFIIKYFFLRVKVGVDLVGGLYMHLVIYMVLEMVTLYFYEDYSVWVASFY